MRTDSCYLGIDVGSVSTNLVLVDDNGRIIEKLYLRTEGKPIEILQNGLNIMYGRMKDGMMVRGVGTTGSGRLLASVMVGADVVKNEITTHAIAAQNVVPDVRTVLEIGGQDSKIIIIRNKVIYDFAMNTVCAAGTGSFLDRQASRLGIPIEEFGGYALKAVSSIRIAGRCAVFAESDMIHKQQTGHSMEDIIRGLCDALVRNYLSNLAKGKEIEGPIVFQGGVAANVGIIAAFEKALGEKLVIPEHYDVMGAFGAALIARQKISENGGTSNFHGFDKIKERFRARSIECQDCSNTCEVIEIIGNEEILARWGDRCGKWSESVRPKEEIVV